MRIPAFVLVGVAVLLALPVGWGAGVVLAYAIAGRDFGQLPALTVPLAIVAAIAFAVSSAFSAERRLAIMAAATVGFIVLSFLTV